MRSTQLVVKPVRQSGNLRNPRGIPNQRSARRAKPGHRGSFEPAPLRQPRSPLLPEVAVPVSQLPVSLEPLVAFGADSLRPHRAGLFGFRAALTRDLLRQHIQVMHITQKVLNVFQIVAPSFIARRQKALHGVTKSLHSDSQRVPMFRLIRTQHLSMQLFRRFVPLECEALGSQSVQRNNADPP